MKDEKLLKLANPFQLNNTEKYFTFKFILLINTDKYY